MKVCFFGGTFNPPHIGHINACKRFTETVMPDKLLVIPTNLPPLKQAYSISPAHRLEMCRKAFPFAEICDFEIQNGGVSYTYKTVMYLKERFPDAQLYMLIGTDQLAQLEKWKNYEYLKETLVFGVVNRYNGEDTYRTEIERQKQMGVKLVEIDVDEIEISSSKLRENLSEEFLTPEVFRYIKENFLYMDKTEQIVKDLYAQKPRRIAHIEGVCKCALMLRDHCFPDIPDEKVKQAAYMHDFTKEWSLEKQIEFLKSHGVQQDQYNLPEKLLHAHSASIIAEKVYKLDSDVCSAVFYHTTGRENMEPLEKIIYLADYIEETRTHIDCIDVRDTYTMLREQQDSLAIDRAILYSLDLTLEELLKKRQYIHPRTLAARNYLFLNTRN